MGSRSYGEPDFGNETATSSAKYNSRKGRSKQSSNNSDNKPKQPRRGLGVAQLEKIRLMHSQMAAGYNHNNTTYLPLHNPFSHNSPPQEYMRRQALYSSSSSFLDSPPSSSSYCFSGNPSVEMGDNIGYAYSQTDDNTIIRDNDEIGWPQDNAFQGTHQFTPPIITGQLFNESEDDSVEGRRRKGRNNSMGSTTYYNYESDVNQDDLDLELRLSL